MTWPRPRPVLLSLVAVAFLWTIAVALTGGFRIVTALGTISSRDWDRPLILAIALVMAYLIKYQQYWPEDLRVLGHLRPDVLAAVCAVAAVTVGVRWGTFIASGPDASGYVSQADMWRRGALTIAAPAWAAEAPWAEAVWSSAPVGYRPQRGSSRLVPTYSPGLPLMMALFQTFGGPRAVFYVVPLWGALAVWCTFLLACRFRGPWAGTVAAVLLLASPPFLWYVTQPMSDVVVTAWWAAAVVLAWRHTPNSTALAGACSAVAILVRPNVVPLFLVVALLVAMDGRLGIRRLLLYAGAAAPGPLVIAALNWYWYGSPLRSGYSTLDGLYEAANMWPNVQRYSTWLLDAQTPLILLGFAAPFVLRYSASERRRAGVLIVGFPLILFASYVAYLVIDTWLYLRFLLPAYPVMLAGVAAVLVGAIERLKRSAMVIGAVVAITAFVALSGLGFVHRNGLFDYAATDQRFARAVSYANDLPENVVLVSNAYSGTLHFYTGHDVLRWEVLAPTDLDGALAYLRALGHPLYFIGDQFEVDQFVRYFAGTRAVETFDKRFVTGSYGFVVYDLTSP